MAEAAKAGDIDALGILDEASVCLADLAAAVARRVGNDELPVSLLGGTSHMGDIFTKRFESALKRNCRNAVTGNLCLNPLSARHFL